MKNSRKESSGGIQTVRIDHSTIVYRNGQHIELYSIRTPRAHRGKGSAGNALNWLIDLADEYGKKIRLLASPLDTATKTSRLVTFYQRYGFELTGETGNPLGDPWMEREPQIQFRK